LHQRIDDGGNLFLAVQNRLAGAGMLVADPIRRFNERITGQRIVGDVGHILGERCDVAGSTQNELEESPTACCEPTVGAVHAAFAGSRISTGLSK